jgi:hypothetical protein
MLMEGTSVPSGSMIKPMNGGSAVTRRAETNEVMPRRGQRHERIGLWSPGNTGPERRILSMRKSSKSRASIISLDVIVAKRQGGQGLLGGSAR